ncbi:lactate/malate family dehydrogenase [Carnobacterium funditum]|uniref:lactate/malate family dehydrogenase n=1 Tax=Carnobacterium funditum TaxID=2752 RepID=UPI0005505739|nr:lactate dehydrogenase [Carnobacterium funditum]
MSEGQGKKIIIVGTDETTYQFAFLSMLKLKVAKILFYQLPSLEENKIRDLQFASSFSLASSFAIANAKDFLSTDLLIITAQEERKSDESDNDYIRRNISLIRKVIKKAMANGFSGLILIATEPTDMFTYLVWKFSGLPKEKIVGLGTYIDSILFRQLLSKKLSVSSRDVNAFIVGGSSKDSKVTTWSRSNIGGNPILSLMMDKKNHFNQNDRINIETILSERDLFSRETNSYFTNVSALVKLTQLIFTDEKALVTLMHLVDIEDLVNIPLSLPVLLGKEGIIKISELGFSDSEKKELLKVARETRDYLDWIEKG